MEDIIFVGEVRDEDKPSTSKIKYTREPSEESKESELLWDSEPEPEPEVEILEPEEPEVEPEAEPEVTDEQLLACLTDDETEHNPWPAEDAFAGRGIEDMVLICDHCYGPYCITEANDNNLCGACRKQRFLYSP